MPLVRNPTPFRHVARFRRNSSRAREARKFVNKVSDFFVNRNKVAMATVFGYATLLTLFALVVDTDTGCLRSTGFNLYGVLATIESFAAIASAMAVFGLIKVRPMWFGPLLILQTFILTYALIYYVLPFAFQETTDVQMQIAALPTKSIVPRVRIMVVTSARLLFRYTPIAVQIFCIMFTLDVLWSLIVVHYIESYQPLVLIGRARTCSSNNSVNSRTWSSMRRKIQVRRQKDHPNQVQHLSKPELYLEMSAKFRKTTYPKVHCVDETVIM